MLELKKIVKTYTIGDETVTALDGISICFRRSEFVSILGPSGCGKTTLLNIIGGLDHYTDGDLVINGRSTKDYTEADFDVYRNHSIGFVFQSYNLIPHQTVLANVELALTLSGVSRSERRRRAEDALRRVGLERQMHKKPNQMSGGQMQRVAIARALVNDPDILLADEPTGALDSETSVQVMDILREVARDRLVIMVTHNPSLATEYSTRIIRVLDGHVTDDSDPYDGKENDKVGSGETCGANVSDTEFETNVENSSHKGNVRTADRPAKRKSSMSFLTALSLSLNNLMTKKTRTFMTSFAGSIGIIGIALILSVSTGVNAYISKIQEDTLTSYPLTINSESDMVSMLGSFMNRQKESSETPVEDGYIRSRNVMSDMIGSLSDSDTNDLRSFKSFLDSSEEMNEYASSIRYGYDAEMCIYAKDENGKIVPSDMNKLMGEVSADLGMTGDSASMYTSSTFSSMSSFDVWQELLPGENGEAVSPSVKDSYELEYGRWPEAYDEAVLVVSRDCELSDYVLYALGFKPYDEMVELMRSSITGDTAEESRSLQWTYDDILSTEFRLVMPSDKFQRQDDGTYVDLSATEAGLSYLYGNDDISMPIRLVGIIRSDDDTSAMLTGAVAYTAALTDRVIEYAKNSDTVREQAENRDTDIISGLPFRVSGEELSEADRAERISAYMESLEIPDRAELYREIMTTPDDDYIDGTLDEYLANTPRDTLEDMIVNGYAQKMGSTDTADVRSYLDEMDDAAFEKFFRENARDAVSERYSETVGAQLSVMSDDELVAAFESAERSATELAAMYDRYMPSEFSDSTYDANMKLFGYVDEAQPSSVNIYVSTFSDKDHVTEIIRNYNESVPEESQIKYTDYFELLMSSISTVINAISYVLVAFVAISLVVSSIMIGIITYISVLERTKEIGILRAIGASRRDISRVFNAETLSVGFTAGVLGIIISLLLIIPINIIIHNLVGTTDLSAQLPIVGAAVLVGISMLLTFIAGLIPSRIAARRDPVVALRTE